MKHCLQQLVRHSARHLPILALALIVVLCVAPSHGAEGPDKPGFQATTRIAVENGFWMLRDKPTYQGTKAEGLLFNVRMVHAIFEDRNDATRPDGFDADANTNRFIAHIPKYAAQGVLAFTIHLQGGAPGYDGTINSAFDKDGSLRAAYLARAARVIEACDAAGLAVILGCLSPQQDQHLEDADAARKAVEGVAEWLHRNGYRNVLLEVIDNHRDPGYDHEALRDTKWVVTVLESVRKKAPGLLVAASGTPNGRISHPVGGASDVLLLRFDRVEPDLVFRRAATAAKHVKALVCNADSKTGDDAVAMLDATTRALCSWGYTNPRNETYPFQFDGPADDPKFYAKLKELTRS